MKTVVLANDLTTANVIDRSVYEHYIALLEKDIAGYFLENDELIDVNCPGCGKQESQKHYSKMGMRFKLCSNCGSHYVSPRPDARTLQVFFKDSKACQYWREQINNLEDAQLYYIYGPRVNWISELVDEFLPEPSILLDYETKYAFLLKHIHEKKIFKQIGTYQPELFEQMDSLPKETLMGDQLKSCEGNVSVLTAFESVERAFEPKEIFTLAARYCQPGGLLLLTAASSSGFEYQVLGEHAPNINPVNRMNLLSIEALTDMIDRAGFEMLELSTPGRLDVDIVKRAMETSKDLTIDPFWRYILQSREHRTLESLQKFLQENRLSSHVRIAARKK